VTTSSTREKQERNARILDLASRGLSQREIAKKVGINQTTVMRVIDATGDAKYGISKMHHLKMHHPEVMQNEMHHQQLIDSSILHHPEVMQNEMHHQQLIDSSILHHPEVMQNPVLHHINLEMHHPEVMQNEMHHLQVVDNSVLHHPNLKMHHLEVIQNEANNPSTVHQIISAKPVSPPLLHLIQDIRVNNIPAELKVIPQYVCWCWKERAEKPGKWTKPPFQPNGRDAKVNDPSTWVTFDVAITAYSKGGFSGIGIVLTPEIGIVGVDLDHCLNHSTGTVASWAIEIVNALPTYWEISPSGEGLRGFVKGTLPQEGRKKGYVEMYNSGRYVTITGHHFNGTVIDDENVIYPLLKIATLADELLAVHEKIFSKPDQKNIPTAKVKVKDVSSPPSLHSDDRTLIDYICANQKQGARFAQLWAGDYGGRDQSAADQGLCNILAFWTNKDSPSIDRLFRQSGLMRDKWDEKRGERTYGQITIDKAIAGTREGYTGSWQTEATKNAQETIHRSSFRVFDDRFEHDGVKCRSGVWFFGTDKDGNETKCWISSPLYIEAVTYDGNDNNFGRMLRFRNTTGRWREWAMPMELLSGLGNEIRAELLAMGVEISHDSKARNLLASYLQEKPPMRRMRCAIQTGWCGKSFVLPDVVIGPDASNVIFQSGERSHDEYSVAGTLDGWKNEIAARAIGNPLLVLSISCAFVGPLLMLCNAESGGAHLVGDSSTGKTTVIEVGSSVWGGKNYRRSWRATANGMEGAAALSNDLLLPLDEINEADPREVGITIYGFGNGVGKQRANRTGTARSVTRWRCFVLSSGERTIATVMSEVGHKAKAGQAVRMLDIPSMRKYGAWDNLHGMSSGTTFSDAIKKAVAMNHGHVGREFLEILTRDTRDFHALLDGFKAMEEFTPKDSEGQDNRVAARFALLAMAGELATKYGLTGWSNGEATNAASECFKEWRTMRGKGNGERLQILGNLSDFIDRHGDSRFSNIKGTEITVRDRAGWWRDEVGRREYLFTGEGLREALKGFDFNRALDVLQEVGALPRIGEDGKRAKVYKVGGRPVKLYHIQQIP